MLLAPKKTSYSKSFSSKKVMKDSKGSSLTNKFGSFVLLSNEVGRVTNFQMETVRRFLRRFLKKKGRIFFRIFPSVPVTKKPKDIRLGRGKADLYYWCSNIRKDQPILEVRGYDSALIKKTLMASRIKFSVKTSVLNSKKRWIF